MAPPWRRAWLGVAASLRLLPPYVACGSAGTLTGSIRPPPASLPPDSPSTRPPPHLFLVSPAPQPFWEGDTVLGEGSVLAMPGLRSSSPASRSCLLPSPAAGRTAATHWGMFSVGSLNSVPPEPCVSPRPPTLWLVQVRTFPASSGRSVPFLPKVANLSGTGIRTGRRQVFLACLCGTKIRRAPPSLQKLGEVSPSPMPHVLPC